MASISVDIKRNFTDARMAKQLPFAAAKALTQTAKDAQKDILGGLPDHFTLRGNWFNPSNKFGIKIQPATKTDLVARVGTMADWLIIQEEGGTKKPRGSNLAIPTENVRRNKKDIIQKSQRPRALGSKAFILKIKRAGANQGHSIIFTRKGKGKRSELVALYNLTKQAKIRRNSGVIDPGLKSIVQNLNRNFMNALEFAMKTAK
jgi:hypothetical protein